MSSKKGPKRLTKVDWGACWRLQGEWEAAVKCRDEEKARLMVEGMSHIEAAARGWLAAQKAFPLKPGTRKEWEGLKAEARKVKRPRRDLALAPVEKAANVETRTGIELFDWVYANLTGVPSGEPAKGDLLFLESCRRDPDEFYRKFYLPALMKNKGVSAPPPSEPQDSPDDSELSTESLLKTLMEASR